MLLCKDFESLMFKPIRSVVETIVKLAPLCILACSLHLVLSFLSVFWAFLYDHPTFLAMNFQFVL